VPRHRERIATHLKSLDPSDRYLRFGHATSDEQIDRYVATLDFDRDEVFGIFNRRLSLIAVAHVAYASEPQLPGQPAMVEFGVSVAKKARGRGYGKHLFKQAMLHARNRGIDTLFIYALSENAAMIHIARAEGARVERDGPDSQAWLKLPPGSFGSQLDEMFGRQAAELQYGLRRQARKLDGLIDVVEEVKGRMKSPASE
jgi:RimJ/RimL family protein N-acetyltransferase